MKGRGGGQNRRAQAAANKLIDRHPAGDYSMLYPEDQLDTFIDYHPNGVTHLMTGAGIQTR